MDRLDAGGADPGEGRWREGSPEGLATQRDALERVARARGDEVAEWYAEKASGRSLKRVELDRLRSDARYALSTRGERHGPEDQDPHDFGVSLPTRRKARLGEWDLDAEWAVDEHDRERLEHLCRYLLRPPLALDRLRLLDDGKVCVELKRPWGDHTTHVTMTPDAFIA